MRFILSCVHRCRCCRFANCKLFKNKKNDKEKHNERGAKERKIENSLKKIVGTKLMKTIECLLIVWLFEATTIHLWFWLYVICVEWKLPVESDRNGEKARARCDDDDNTAEKKKTFTSSWKRSIRCHSHNLRCRLRMLNACTRALHDDTQPPISTDN